MVTDCEVTRDGNTLNILLGKDLSVDNASSLSEELSKYSGQGIERIVFDATGLIYLTSSGIRTLLYAYQDLGSKPDFIFLNCAKEIYEVLDLVGMTRFIKFQESPEKKEQYRQRFIGYLSINEVEQAATERKEKLKEFSVNNDVVCYSMKLGQEDS